MARDTATAAGGTFARHMNDSDALLWNIERDPVLRSTITAIAVLDREPDWDRLRDRVAHAVDEVPRLRERVVVPPLHLGPPRWVTDPGFDLDFHLRRARPPAPGSMRQGFDVAGPVAMAAFDRARPLWEFTLLEGLEDGRAMFVQKIHHSVTDGVGGVRLAMVLVDLEREPARADVDGPSSDGHVDAVLDTVAPPGLLEPLLAAPGHAVRAGVQTANAVSRLAGRGLREPRTVLRETAHTAMFGARLLEPVTAPMSPLLRGRGLGRRLDVLDVPMDALHDAAHAAGASLNDAFVAAIAGGLRAYHEAHGVAVHELRMTMPINLRADDDPMGGNRFSPARFAVPVAVRDPAERMQAIAARAHVWRDEPALALTDVLAAGLNRLPTTMTTRIFGSMLKGVDFVATNVPGPPVPVYLAGGAVQREYAFAPPSGSAVSFALLSYDDTCCIGINVDTTAVTDPERLTACLRDAFDEILALAPACAPVLRSVAAPAGGA
jgi:WS/DGAT/MGAT family acyltransferase